MLDPEAYAALYRAVGRMMEKMPPEEREKYTPRGRDADFSDPDTDEVELDLE